MCPGQWAKFSEKCPLVRDISIFWALPGAGRRRTFRKLYDFFLHVLLLDVFSESFVDSQIFRDNVGGDLDW